MSVQAFHYIQVQLFQYYEMQQMEKKEAIVWGKRTHLALKAYQELLLTLDSMDRSGNTVLVESSKVMKSNIFYMMEFRDIFLTLLRHFDQSRQSRAYLKDLVETSHLFLKMLEHFSKKTGHLIVQKKKRGGGARKKKPKKAASTGHVEPTEQELDDLWDEISGELSSLFQGRSDIPGDVAPFDAASEIDVDQQRVDAMLRIQDSMRNQEPGVAVAVLRAAREVWPDRNEFGAVDISPEDEFMALREIFMTALPRPSTEIPGEVEELPGQEDEDEVMEEELLPIQTCEQEFDFRDFAVRFAKPEILKAYVLMLGDFQQNSSHTNHCCVKMLHRIAVDLGYVGMIFQISLFRVFQKIVNSPLASAQRYKEISKFATYVVRKFVEVAENNKKVFMEMLFWKSNKDAIEIVEGYGSYQGKAKQLWTEDAEMEIRRLFEEYQINPEDDKDTVECIMERITGHSKTRGQVIRELKKQELIHTAKDLKKPKTGTRAGAWMEEDELELQQLYDQYREAPDPVGSILSEMCKKRSRGKVMEKLLSLGLVSDRKELYKKRGGKSGGRSRRGGQGSDDSGDEGLQELPSDYEDDDVHRNHDNSSGSNKSSGVDGSSSDSDEPGARDTPGPAGDNAGAGGVKMADIIRGLVTKGYKDQIAWIQRGLSRTAGDRDEEDEDVGVPIVPLTEENETAMEDGVFLDFLSKIGLAGPANEQESFWRIPAGITPTELRNIASGLTLDENDKPVNADKIPVKKPASQPKKKKERKKKKDRKEPESTQKKRKYADKFAALKELVKKKAESKITKRIRKSRAVNDGDSDDESNPTEMPSTSENRELTPEAGGSSKKKTKKQNRAPSGSHSDSENDMPVTNLASPASSGEEGITMNQARGSSSQKKRRVKRMVASSSDSDSDDDVPLNKLTAMKPGERDTESLSQSPSQSQNSNQSEGPSQSQASNQSDGPTQSQNSNQSDGSSQSQASNQSEGPSSQSQGSSQSQTGNHSQESQSQPMLFLASSDEESDKENDSSKADAGRPDSAASKRSRSPGSDLDRSGQVKKKARLVTSSDDSDDDKPLSTLNTAEGTFPATLYTQGPESDSDLDDHVPLRKVMNKKKNMIDSDEDD